MIKKVKLVEDKHFQVKEIFVDGVDFSPHVSDVSFELGQHNGVIMNLKMFIGEIEVVRELDGGQET